MNDAGTEASVQQLMDDLRAVAGDAEALLAATADAAGERVAAARRKATESLQQARQRLGELEEEYGARAAAAREAVDGYVRGNPWTSVGIALAAGLFVGLVFSRRRA
jgi:ElaB/YqjD/DUF883 family membrane-anchored ribosome-binding protein